MVYKPKKLSKKPTEVHTNQVYIKLVATSQISQPTLDPPHLSDGLDDAYILFTLPGKDVMTVIVNGLDLHRTRRGLLCQLYVSKLVILFLTPQINCDLPILLSVPTLEKTLSSLILVMYTYITNQSCKFSHS